MGLLEDIRDGVLDEQTSLGSVLRRRLMLANQLQHQALTDWLNHELDGYPDGVEVPPYRTIRTTMRGNFTTFTHQMTNYPIPGGVFSEEETKKLTTLNLRWGVDELEAIASQDEIRLSLPHGMESYVTSQIDDEAHCISIWNSTSSATIRGVLGAVRTKLLSYTLSIQRDFPQVEQVRPGTLPVSESDLDRRFNVYILGQNPVVSMGGGDVLVQQVNQLVVVGDLDSLRSFLSREGVDEEDLAALEKELQDEPDPAAIAEGRGKVGQWVEQTAGKLVRGSGTVVKESAKAVLTKAVLAYLGVG